MKAKHIHRGVERILALHCRKTIGMFWLILGYIFWKGGMSLLLGVPLSVY